MAAEQVDVLIIGAGPAGLAAAAELRRLGMPKVLVVDREAVAGGVPRMCHHIGFGMYDLRRFYSGPTYARHYVAQAEKAGAAFWPETTITGWAGPTSAQFTSPRGLGQIEARAVLLATGCRERPRAARLVPGSRPAGVFTTGSLQRFLYEQHLPVGRRAVIVGAEIVSLSAFMTLGHARVPVARMVTELPGHQITFPYVGMKVWLMDMLRRTPITPEVRVTRLYGQRRVEGVELTHLTGGQVEQVECDTVVFTGDWVPEQELARAGGLALHEGSHGPRVDGAFRTTRPGVFAAGNVVRGAETADVSALEGRAAAGHIARYLEGGAWPRASLPIEVEPPLEWIFPNAIAPETPLAGGFKFRVRRFCRNASVAIHQGERRLNVQRVGSVRPNWSARLDAGWVREAALDGEPLRATLSD